MPAKLPDKLPAAPPSLRELQLWMRSVITNKDAKSCQRLGVDALSWILPSEVKTRNLRLGIYEDGYFARIVESMEQDFPALRRNLGEGPFLMLIGRYLKSHPSRFTNIGEVGSQLPAFLISELATDFPRHCAELARLEWAIIEAFYATHAERLDPKSLSDIPPSAWSLARFAFDPSVRLMRTEWPVYQLWLDRHDELASDLGKFDLVPESQQLVIVRNREGVEVRLLTEAQSQILRWLKDEKASLGEVCEKLIEAAPEGEAESSPPLMEWFGQWVQMGIFEKIVIQDPETPVISRDL